MVKIFFLIDGQKRIKEKKQIILWILWINLLNLRLDS